MQKSYAHSLVITAYHKDKQMADMTQNCLDSLTDIPDEIIVVDDASPYFADITGADVYHRREVNGGFPECANTGFKLAQGDIIILSNNDITFSKGWLEALLKPLNEGFDISHVNVSDSEDTVEEDVITEDDYFGSLWAMKRKVYETIGGFDERFKNGTFEDKDFYLRAKRAGFKIGKNRAYTVEHIGRATMDKVFPNQEDFYANRERFIEKWGFPL